MKNFCRAASRLLPGSILFATCVFLVGCRTEPARYQAFEPAPTVANVPQPVRSGDTVTYHLAERYYYVDGETLKRGPLVYLGATDVFTAIAASGGFTEFANRQKIRLIHPNGKTDIIDYDKAIATPVTNNPVYPGDKIYVPRRFL